MVNDISRAYFYAPAKRNLFINLPKEDLQAKHDEVGWLNVSLYGTRDAARSWQESLSEHMVSLGFRRGCGFPSVFWHPTRLVMVLVHGDDYVSAGPEVELDWLKKSLEEKYKTKSQILNSMSAWGSEIKVLNRVIRRTREGYELEADPRHCEIIVEALCEKDSKGCATPGVDQEAKEADGDVELEGEQVRCFRGLAARCNYLSTDRPDIQFAVKECCREMSKPTTASWKRLTRVAGYLRRHPRLVWKFAWQHWVPTQDVYGDANWAQCRRVRKSTSGGLAMFGSHCIKSWSKTQSLIAKSSAESELYGLVRASCEALGLQTLSEDLGHQILSRVHIDATAAKSIAERQGLDRVRHIDVNILWLQDQQARERLPLHKILGTANPADLMTKNLAAQQIETYLKLMHLEYRDGRPESAAQLYNLTDTNTNQQTDSTDAAATPKSLQTSNNFKDGNSDNIRKKGLEDFEYPDNATVDGGIAFEGNTGDDVTRKARSKSKAACDREVRKQLWDVKRRQCLRGRTLADLDGTEGVGEAQTIEDGDAGMGGSRDRWLSRGDGGHWLREHASKRRALFTPYRIPRGPSSSCKLMPIRITRGVNEETGKKFTIIDDWTLPSTSHRRLKCSWTGTTSFHMPSNKKLLDELLMDVDLDAEHGQRGEGLSGDDISGDVTYAELCRMVRQNFPAQARALACDIPELNPDVSWDVGA